MGPDPSGWSRRWIVFLLWIALASVANGFVSNTNQQQQSQQQPQQQQNQQSGSQKLPKPPQAPKSPKDFVTTISGDGGPPIGLTNVGTPGTSTFTPVFLTDSEAVCNDGSQGELKLRSARPVTWSAPPRPQQLAEETLQERRRLPPPHCRCQLVCPSRACSGLLLGSRLRIVDRPVDRLP